MNHFSELQSQHEELLQQESAGDTILTAVQAYLKDIRYKSSEVSSAQEREQLRANGRYWASYIYAKTGTFPNTDLAPFSGEIPVEPSGGIPKVWVAVGILALLIPLSIFIISRLDFSPIESEVSEEIVAIATENAISETSEEIEAIETENAIAKATNAAVTQTLAAMETVASSITATPLAVIIASPTVAISPTPAPTAELNGITAENVPQMQSLMTLGGNSGAMLDVAFSPDGQQLAASGADGTVRLWDMNAINAPSWTLELDQTGWTQVVAYNAIGTQLATGGNDRSVRIVDMEGYPFAQFSGHEGFIFGLDYTPDSLQLASGDGNGVLILWNVASGGLLSATTIGKDAIRELDFSPKQEFLAVANGSDGFKMLAYPSLRQQCAFDGMSVLTTAVSNDNTFTAFGTGDGMLIRVDSNCAILDRTQAHNGAVNSVALNENGNLMVSGGDDGIIFIMPGQIQLTGHTDAVQSIAINPQGTIIASASADGTIILWGIPSK